MNPHDRAVDHLDLATVRLRYRIHQPIPDAGFAPAIEAIVGRRVRAVALRQVAPRRTSSQYPENAVHHPAIILALGPRSAPRQHPFDDRPLRIRQVIAHDQRSQPLGA